MRTTLIIDDELLARARELSGLKQEAAIVHAGLRALIARESARRLAALGGDRAEPQVSHPSAPAQVWLTSAHAPVS